MSKVYSLEPSNITVEDPLKYSREQIEKYHNERLNKKVEFEKYELPKIEIEFTTWEKIQMVWYYLPALWKVFYLIVQLYIGIHMNVDKKTTITAVIGVLVTILGIFGINIAPEMKDTIIQVILGAMTIVTFIIGLFTGKKSE